MKTSRCTEAQIITILRQAEGGVPVEGLVVTVRRLLGAPLVKRRFGKTFLLRQLPNGHVVGAAASASAQPIFVPVNISRYRPIPPT
jgi:hypothetical protein